MGEDVDGGEVGDGGDADGGAAVVREDEECGALDAEETVVGDAVHHGAHPVLKGGRRGVAARGMGARGRGDGEGKLDPLHKPTSRWGRPPHGKDPPPL